ncbi:MAG: DMT family transporter [Anaerolineales bacterium]|nr:DMT family transporter [Anaerolineales bacterium]
MKTKSLPYIVTLGVLYGTTMVASRFSVALIKPATYISLRMMIASLGFLVIYGLRLGGRRFPHSKKLWKQAALLGIFGTITPMLLIVSSLQYQSSGVTSVLVTSSPAITILMAHLFLHDEKITWIKGIGITLALGGGLFLAIRGESGLPDLSAAKPIGYIMVLVGMLSGSAMTIYARKYMGEQNVFDVAGARIFVSAMVMIPWSIYFLREDIRHLNVMGWEAVFYAAVSGTFIAILLDFYNVKHFGATASAMVSYVVPIVASFIGVILLHETVTLGMLAGMVLILIGLVLINVF